MNNFSDSNRQFFPPFKSVAAALLFGAFLGPVGLLYSSVTGSIIMILLGLVVFRMKLVALMVLVWVFSCVWNVAATNRFNQKLLKTLTQ